MKEATRARAAHANLLPDPLSTDLPLLLPRSCSGNTVHRRSLIVGDGCVKCEPKRVAHGHKS